MKQFTHILFLLPIAAVFAVPVLASENGKTKTVLPTSIMGRVVKVSEDAITITVRAQKRRGKVISPEREVTFKLNSETKIQRREGGEESKVTDITLVDMRIKSLVTVSKAVDSDTASLVVMTVKAKKAAQPPPPRAENGRFDIPYGKHERQVLDFYPAESEKPTPLVLQIHGGAWVAGDKRLPADVVKFYNDQGVSVVSINYRYIGHAVKDGVDPPVKASLMDAARALQFVRSKSEEWNIDKERIGATGGSAGGCSSLWLAMHDDMADPESEDPVARESTRLHCAVGIAAQVSLDPQELLEWMPNYIYGAHAFDAAAKPFDRKSGGQEFAAFANDREKFLPWIRDYSPAAHASEDDPPITLFYPGRQDWDDKKKAKKLEQGKRVGPPKKGDSIADPTHGVLHGYLLREKFKTLGVDLRVDQWPGSVRKTTPEWQEKMKQTVVDYLRVKQKLKKEKLEPGKVHNE